MLDFGCLNAHLDWVQNSTQFIPYDNGTMCGWFFNATSDRPMLMLGYQVDPSTQRPNGEILTTRTLPLTTNVSRKTYFGGSINFKHIRNLINNFVVVTTAEGSDPDSMLKSIFQHQKPRAIECVLSWCVKTIQSSYHEATYSEVVKDRFINTTAGPFPWTFIAPDGNDPEDVGKSGYLQGITIDPTNGLGNVSTYGASNETAVSIIGIFDDYLPSFATLSDNSSKTAKVQILE